METSQVIVERPWRAYLALLLFVLPPVVMWYLHLCYGVEFILPGWMTQ